MDEVTSYSFTLSHSTYLNVTGRKIKMPILALLDARAGETLRTGKFWSFPSQQLPFPSWQKEEHVQEEQRWQPLRRKKIGGKKASPTSGDSWNNDAGGCLTNYQCLALQPSFWSSWTSEVLLPKAGAFWAQESHPGKRFGPSFLQMKLHRCRWKSAAKAA